MTRTLAWILAVAILTGSSAAAQQPVGVQDPEGSQDPEGAKPGEIWQLPTGDRSEGNGPGGQQRGSQERQLEGAEVAGRPVLRLTDISAPSLEIFPADPARATGTAVIVCPGGGYRILAYDLEGTEVAAWLQGIGVTALVLKYRVPTIENEEPGKRPLEDLQQAIRTVRQRAAELNIDPQKVGVLGFSAGGHLAILSAARDDEASEPQLEDVREKQRERGGEAEREDQRSAMPNFLIPIYPAYLVDPNAERLRLDPSLQFAADTPPTFIAVTQDDADRAIGASLLMIELKRHQVPMELHVFVRGGHGYGLRVSENAVSRWPELCESWMRAMGFL